MNSSQQFLILALVLTLVLGWLWKINQGKFKAKPNREANVLGPEWADKLGAAVTLVQFSSAFCAPCRTTRVVLTEIAEQHPEVVHLEIDAESQLDLVRRLQIMRTPTTLILDASGQELVRAAGVPKKQVVHQVLAQLATN